MGSFATRQRGMAAREVNLVSRSNPTAAAEGKVEELQELGQFTEFHDTEKGVDIEALTSDLTGEYGNIALLLLLYTLQGVPMGFSGVMPLIMKERGASFSDLGTFSFSSYPFTMKLLWAPIVDVVYIRSFGRRKTWLVPAQLLIGLMLLGLSASLNSLLYSEEPQIRSLTAAFFMLFFLCATQDIAVDGWALTMLRKENVGYAATCNAVGQSFGSALSFAGCMALEHFKVLSLSSFMFLWGIIFIVVTLAVGVAKTEKALQADEMPDDLVMAYQRMFAMTKLRAVRMLFLALCTWKVGFAVMDGAAAFKMQEYGVPKEHMAYMTTFMTPVAIVVPGLVAAWTSTAAPLDLALRAYPWRVALVPLTTALVYMTPPQSDQIPWGFYSLVMLLLLSAAVVSQCMFVSTMAFFNKVCKCDVAMGGTYMTLLNTMANLGGMWPATVAMKLIDATTCKEVTCSWRIDGFYFMSVVCSIFAVIWYVIGSEPTRRLQYLDEAKWKVR